jgi:signal transduction histidine kinase/ligand-binding sensor domain-containing protein
MNKYFKQTVPALFLKGLAALAALLVLLCSTPSARSSGNAGEYLTDLWTADDGLPDSSVTAIAQTPDGYLWVGTYNGLARFDGMRFVTFDPANTPALAHARVRKLSVDSQGTLWINTFDGSMTSLRKGVFAREWTGAEIRDPDVYLVSSTPGQVTFLLHSGILRRKNPAAPPGTGWEEVTPSTNRAVGALCVADGAGTIWYRNSERRLLRMTGAGFEPAPENSGLAGTNVNCMAADAKGRLWVGTEKEIAVWDGNRFQIATPTNAAPGIDVSFFSVSDGDRLWVLDGGLVREAVNRQWTVQAATPWKESTPNLSRMGALDDHRGGVWLYDYGRGLLHVTSDGQTRQFGLAEGFPGERVNCFFEDHEGNWWAGLDAGGLVRLRERRFQTVDTGGQFSATPARSVCEAGDGTLWIGTLGDGLACMKDGIFTNLVVPGGTGRGFAFCVCPDPAGRLWISAGEENLFIYEAGAMRRVQPPVHAVKCILAEKSGRVWVGTKSGMVYAEADDPDEFKSCEEIGRRQVRAMSADGRGNLWVGTEEGTLYRIGAASSDAFIPEDVKIPHAIWSVLADDDGTIWAGTFRGGLLRFKDGKFTRFSVNEGLPDNVICQILPDDAGNLWIGSHQGIFRVSKSELDDFAKNAAKPVAVTTYGRSDGLPSLECSGGYQPAGWRTHDGRLWFTTVKGAVSVKPGEIRQNLLPPPVVIEEILVGGKSLGATIHSPDKPDPAGLVYDREKGLLEVSPGNRQFEFRYTGLSLVSSDRVQFRYRLEGVGADKDWVEAGSRRYAQYNLLPPGSYKFTVTACNSDKVWNENGCSLNFKILPFFYETLWFRIMAWISACGLVACVVWYSVTRKLHEEMERLARQQAVERERARIAKDIHDDLGANLTLIAVLGDLAKQEKAVERIEKMASTARQAVKSLDEIVWAVNPRNDTLAHLLDYTGQFAVDYLRAAGVRCLLDVPEQAPHREVPANVRHNVFLVAKEALQNIVKHAGATEVWLRVAIAGKGLRIVIEDNGCGFDPQATPHPLADGLGNMRQRMNEIGGTFEIRAVAGKGTTIIVEVPWKQD